ncbi:hypothetical protein [Novosphingobium terrae]|uniref:hypothetical protein n=1 Tax=Novosphingobium terrae TaxID=2726189 RepID=UPI0019821AE0|nr:hypothetical protein [Novosphingobium terrae]
MTMSGRAGKLAKRVIAGSLAGLIATQSAAAAPICPISPSPADSSFDYMGTRVDRHGGPGAYTYVTAMKIVDADGAPNAYHPADMEDACPDNGRGLDCLEAAGYPHGSWWQTVLAADPRAPDRPAIQRKGKFKGYFVSMTSLQNVAWGGPANPASYVDASATPYIVLPAPIYRTEGMGAMGDIGYAINLDTGRATPFVIADEGPVEPLGEASMAFWAALGEGPPNARNGEGLPRGRIAYTVFPHSRESINIGWPIDPDRLKAEALRLLAATGGESGMRACALAQSSASVATAGTMAGAPEIGG